MNEHDSRLGFPDALNDGLFVSSDPTFASEAGRIIRWTARARLPTMYSWRIFAEGGGLMSYSQGGHHPGGGPGGSRDDCRRIGREAGREPGGASAMRCSREGSNLGEIGRASCRERV